MDQPSDPAIPPLRDFMALPDLLHGSSRAGRVGERRPIDVDLLLPRNAGCPAGENIQARLAHAGAGHQEQAWRQLVAGNPMPAIRGRVCYHPHESICNRASPDSAISIHSVERFLGDLALERGWSFDLPPARSGCASVGELRGKLVLPPDTDQAAYQRAGCARGLQAATSARSPW